MPRDAMERLERQVVRMRREMARYLAGLVEQGELTGYAPLADVIRHLDGTTPESLRAAFRGEMEGADDHRRG